MEPDPLIQKLEAKILAWFAKGNAQPQTRSELARNLSVPPQERSALRAAVLSLEDQNKLQRFKKNRYGPPVQKEQNGSKLSGRIDFPSLNSNRNAWITLDTAALRALPREFHGDRVFVPARFAGTALPGDHVSFTLHQGQPPKWHRHGRKPPSRSREIRWEARVTRILHRSRTRFPALLRRSKGFAHAIPDERAFPRPFDLNPDELPSRAQDGHLVLVELQTWNSPSKPPLGQVVEVLGRAGDPGVDILKIIHQYELPLEFPHQVVDEATSVPQEVRDGDLVDREDWRERTVYTIDPATARDFDDAICVTPHPDGSTELAVFIADVAHYVEVDSALDREARKRGNSVYLVDRVIPMLPEALSNGICSLNPGLDRLAHAAIMVFDENGNRTQVRFAKAVIRSERRFSYEEAYELMMASQAPQDPEDARFQSLLQDAWRLAERLRQRRMGAGSLDLDFPEVEVVLNEDGTPMELRLVEYDESHQLIEEFMLVANEAVAEFTKNRKAGSIYRVHEDPDPAKLLEFRDLARAYGHRVGDLTTKKELQKLIAEIKSKPGERALSLALLKSLKRAAYCAEPLGHYGLAKLNYTHFTSPIRRYSDLVVHRVLEKLATRTSSSRRLPKRTELEETAEHLSTTERIAADAERDSKMLKQFEYLLNLTREKKRPRFNATVLEITPRGVFVELEDYYLRGLIRKTDLPRRHYQLEPRSQRVLDERGHLLMAPGMSIAVELQQVDVEKRFLDFVPCSSP